MSSLKCFEWVFSRSSEHTRFCSATALRFRSIQLLAKIYTKTLRLKTHDLFDSESNHFPTALEFTRHAADVKAHLIYHFFISVVVQKKSAVV